MSFPVWFVTISLSNTRVVLRDWTFLWTKVFSESVIANDVNHLLNILTLFNSGHKQMYFHGKVHCNWGVSNYTDLTCFPLTSVCVKYPETVTQELCIYKRRLWFFANAIDINDHLEIIYNIYNFIDNFTFIKFCKTGAKTQWPLIALKRQNISRCTNNVVTFSNIGLCLASSLLGASSQCQTEEGSF